MSDRFYTVLVVPEKTSKVRRMVIPSWIVRGLLVGSFFFSVLGVIMFFDYWYVMDQIDENKDLKIDNRRLRQQVQIYKNRMANIQDTVERIETFTTRLKVITNIRDRTALIENLDGVLPDAAKNIGLRPKPPKPTQGKPIDEIVAQERNPEKARLIRDQLELTEQFEEVNFQTLSIEQNLQDLYELLGDQKAFLAALPTQRPAAGYFTSGFGVRKSPTSGKQKMHEGLDIANRPGTPIFSPSNGIVIFAGPKAAYGRTIVIDHGYGLETWYGHTRRILVKKGDKVRRGQRIALMGSTGRSTGSHLHYEVRIHGIPVDPLSYILEN